jgi:hypothetical protein
VVSLVFLGAPGLDVDHCAKSLHCELLKNGNMLSLGFSKGKFVQVLRLFVDNRACGPIGSRMQNLST